MVLPYRIGAALYTQSECQELSCRSAPADTFVHLNSLSQYFNSQADNITNVLVLRIKPRIRYTRQSKHDEGIY